jgi:SP family facilitated glucose transporter-like MFS transporter 8
MFALGLSVAFISVGMDSLKTEGELGLAPFTITEEQIGWFGKDYSTDKFVIKNCFERRIAIFITTSHFSIGTAFAVGGALSCPFSGWVTQRFGRKWPCVACNIPVFISWIMIAFSKTYWLVLLGITLNCAALGIKESIARMHVSELAFPAYRGRMLAAMYSLYSAGTVVGFTAALCLNWKGLAYLNASLPVLSFLVELRAPESHVWLLVNGRVEDAKKALQWAYGNAYDCSAELKESELHLRETKEALVSYKDILDFCYLKPLMVVSVVIVVRGNCGGNAIRYYMKQIANSSSFALPSNYTVIVLGSMDFVFTLISGKVMDTFGRRKTIFTSGLMMGLSEAAFGTFKYLEQSSAQPETFVRYVHENELRDGCNYCNNANCLLRPLRHFLHTSPYLPHTLSISHTLSL